MLHSVLRAYQSDQPRSTSGNRTNDTSIVALQSAHSRHTHTHKQAHRLHVLILVLDLYPSEETLCVRAAVCATDLMPADATNLLRSFIHKKGHSFSFL